MTTNSRIHYFKHTDLTWQFESDAKPFIFIKTKPWGQSVNFDPFPCYFHDKHLVESQIKRNEEIVSVPFKPDYFVFPFECGSRTNGCACRNPNYRKEEDNKEAAMYPYILLYGKRIPIHPAMTRYLVAHEYGHVIHYNLEEAMKIKDGDDDFEKFYAKEIREIEYNKKYGALNWHSNIGEIIAEDIRAGILQVEREFWPHDVCPPWDSKKVMDFWCETNEKYFKT